MIAHKPHLMPAAANQPPGRQAQPMSAQQQQPLQQQQQLPVGHTRHGVVGGDAQQRQYYDVDVQQQYTANSNSSADNLSPYHHHHHLPHQQQHQIISNNSNHQPQGNVGGTNMMHGESQMRFQRQPIGQEQQLVQQQQQYHQPINGQQQYHHHHHSMTALDPQQQQQQHRQSHQAHPQVPQPPATSATAAQATNQLPYHTNQQAYEQHQAPLTQTMQSSPTHHHHHQNQQQHYVSIQQQQQQQQQQQSDAHIHPQQIIHDPQQQQHPQQRHLQQNLGMQVTHTRPGAGHIQPPPPQQQHARVSPYSSNQHQQQMQPVRQVQQTTTRVAAGQHQQYKPMPRDFQQHQIPVATAAPPTSLQPPQSQLVLPPNNASHPQQQQHQHQQHVATVANYPSNNNPAASNGAAYLMNGTNPQASFMEGDQTGSPTTLLQQQLDRQVPAQQQQQQPLPHHHHHHQQQQQHQHQHQRLGPVQQSSPSPNHPVHQQRMHHTHVAAPQQRPAPPPPQQMPLQAGNNNKLVRSGNATLYVNNEHELIDPYEVQQQHLQPGSRSNMHNPSMVPRPGGVGITTHTSDQYNPQAPLRSAAPPPPPSQRMAPVGPQRTVLPLNNQQQQQQQPPPQMMMTMMENSGNNHPPPHLLGNPTPPLTPNATQLGGQRPTTISHPPANAAHHSWQPTHHQHHTPGDHVPPQSQLQLQPQPPPANNRYSGLATSPSIKQSAGGHLQSNQVPIAAEGPATVQHQHQHQRIMPKSVASGSFQQQKHHQYHNQAPASQVATNNSQLPPHHLAHSQSQQQQQVPSAAAADSQPRLTLPLRDTPLLGPFRLEHDEQFISRVFHIKPQLFEALSKSMSLVNPQAATVVQELQFRAYLPKQPSSHHHHHHNQGDSLLAPNQQQQQQQQQHHAKPCNWPEHFQVSVNENVIHLDRSKVAPHRAVDIFQFCRMGDNVLEMQVNDCYCSHEFVLEAVDRPTVKAFMSSCFKSRRLNTDACIQKLKFNFGAPGFLVSPQQQQQYAASGVTNEYISDFVNGLEQTKVKVSLRCPMSGRRMRTPTRGYHCKHLQCFDLEVFLSTNRERSRWNCPLCSLAVPFNMLELDQHQMDMLHAMPPDTDDILVDESGQWLAYYAPLAQQQQSQPPLQQAMHIQPQQQQPQQQQPIMQTAKSTGTYHPQAPTLINGASPGSSGQPMRPQSGPIIPTVNRVQPVGQPVTGPMSSWDSASANQPPHLDCHSPVGPVRRPASAISQPTGRRSANGSPLAKKAYAGQYAHPPQSVAVPSASTVPTQQQQQSAYFGNGGDQQTQQQQQSSFNTNDTDDLSPLAAMERTIIQHEQQMGPPPFDPNSLTSSPAPLRSSSSNSVAAGSSSTHAAGNSASLISPTSATGNQSSNQAPANPSANVHAAFSPAAHGIANSPAGGARMVPASPQQQQQQHQQQRVSHSDIPPQSPMQPLAPAAQQQTSGASSSKPATPSSMLMHNAPEAPSTPGHMQHSVSTISHSPHVAGGSVPNSAALVQQQQSGGVDHQPLSNGSASAGSITSSSTMTPSNQSLGSVGMGGDSRCGTAPLQVGGQLGLDDLMLPGGSHQAGMSHQFKHSPHVDEKNEIMMGKLMMDSSESLLHRNGELAMALEEAEWKQQLDRGKSEHLANFLNEPLMKKQQQHHYQQQAQHQQGPGNKMLSGGLDPSEDEGNQSHGSSPGHNIDQLEFANYLDADAVDNGADLPPDDSILDLFER